MPDEVAALFDRADSTQALELIWQRVRRLNRYVEERQPWQLAKDPDSAAELDQVLASLYEGVRVVTRAARAVHPRERREAAGRARRPGKLVCRGRVSAAGPLASGVTVSSVPPLFPKRDRRQPESTVGRQPHPPAHLRAAGRGAGRRRGGGRASRGWSRSALTSRARRRRSRRPSASRRSTPRSASTRTQATGFSDGDYTALERMAQHPRCVAIGETGLDYYRDHASHEDQATRLRAQIEIARRSASRW